MCSHGNTQLYPAVASLWTIFVAVAKNKIFAILCQKCQLLYIHFLFIELLHNFQLTPKKKLALDYYRKEIKQHIILTMNLLFMVLFSVYVISNNAINNTYDENQILIHNKCVIPSYLIYVFFGRFENFTLFFLLIILEAVVDVLLTSWWIVKLTSQLHPWYQTANRRAFLVKCIEDFNCHFVCEK